MRVTELLETKMYTFKKNYHGEVKENSENISKHFNILKMTHIWTNLLFSLNFYLTNYMHQITLNQRWPVATHFVLYCEHVHSIH